jgi:hypothetical protein
VTVKIADFQRLLFPLWRDLRWVGRARNAARPEPLSRQVALGRPLFFADFGGRDFPSVGTTPEQQLAVACSVPSRTGSALGASAEQGICDLRRVAFGWSREAAGF